MLLRSNGERTVVERLDKGFDLGCLKTRFLFRVIIAVKG